MNKSRKMLRVGRAWAVVLLVMLTAAEATLRRLPAAEAASASSPSRVLDTRVGIGAPVGKVVPGQVLSFQIPSAASAGATSVVLNLTATEADGAGWVRAWPCDEPQPNTSSLNFSPAHVAEANAVVVKLGPSGVCLSTYASVHLIADLQGWFAGSSDFVGTSPSRLLDTRVEGAPLHAGDERRLAVGGTAGIPSNAAFAALNVTVDQPPSDGWVVAYPCGVPTDGSTVNFKAGETVATLTFVALTDGDVCLRTWNVAHVVVDAFGWSAGAGALQVQSPSRILDTRDRPTWPYGQLAAGRKIALRVAGRGGVPNTATGALLNVTVADTGGAGYVTAWPCDQPHPGTSTLNTWPDQLRSNLAYVRLAADGTVCLQLYSSNSAPLDLIVDALGWDGGAVSRPLPPSTPSPPTNGSTPGDAAPVSSGAQQVVGGHDSGCVLSKADQPTNIAFCESFGQAFSNTVSSRSGDLDTRLWGVSRIGSQVNQGQGQLNDWAPATLRGCGDTQTVLPPADVRVCGGRLFEAAADDGGQTTLAVYPKQPFDIAGRTGTVAFDVSADSAGPHAAWPEFWYTDLPVPAPHGEISAQKPYAQNSFGFDLKSPNCGVGSTTVGSMMVTRNYVLSQVPFKAVGCVLSGDATGALNHFELRLSQGRAEVWGSDPGSLQVRLLAYADDINLTMTRGVVWLEDVHYNACKFDEQCDHEFAWDNLGFDGPALYRDLTFDVPDNGSSQSGGTVRLGYLADPQGSLTLTTAPAYWLKTPAKAYVGLNWFPYEAVVPSVSLNGGPWHEVAWPFDDATFTWRTIAIPVDLSEVRAGPNTISLKFPDMGTTVSNINLILINASPTS